MLEDCSSERLASALWTEDSLIATTGLGSNGHEHFPPQVASQAAKFHKGAGQPRVEGERKVCELSLNSPGNSRSTGWVGWGGGEQFYSKLRSCIPQMETEATEVRIRQERLSASKFQKVFLKVPRGGGRCSEGMTASDVCDLDTEVPASPAWP